MYVSEGRADGGKEGYCRTCGKKLDLIVLFYLLRNDIGIDWNGISLAIVRRGIKREDLPSYNLLKRSRVFTIWNGHR